MFRNRSEIRGEVLADLLKLRLGEGLNAGRNALVAEQDHRGGELAGDVHRLDRGVEAVLNAARGDHHPGAVAMTAKGGDVEVGLLDVGRHPRGGTAALHINDHQRHLRHGGPADGLGLEGDARAGRTGHRNAPTPAATNGHRHGGDLVFALNEGSAVLGQLLAKQFHNIGPRSDRVAGTEADARGQQPIGDGLVPVHHHLGADLALGGVELVTLQQVFQRVIVAGVEAGVGVVEDRGVLAAKALGDELLQLGDVEVIDFRQQAEYVDVLALVAAGAADGFHGEAGDGHADVAVALLPLGLRGHVVGIIQHDAAKLQRLDVVLVAVLVEGKQHVGLVAGGEHFT